MPLIPIRIYIIFAMICVLLPTISATKSTSNSPTKAQFIAPIIIRTKAIFLIVSKFHHPFFLFILFQKKIFLYVLIEILYIYLIRK